MNEAASGELPLHPPPSAAATTATSFTYADYWRALAASAPERPSLASTKVPLSPSAPKRSPSASTADGRNTEPGEESSAPTTPHRFIHAATGAYRLRLSLSPTASSVTASAWPLVQRSPNVQPPCYVTHPTNSFMTASATASSASDSRREQPQEAPRHQRPEELRGVHVENGVDSLRSLRASLDPAPKEKRGPVPLSLQQTVGELYALDAQVLQAVRCYEEWRHCLCAKDPNVSSPSCDTKIEQHFEKAAEAEAGVEGRSMHDASDASLGDGDDTRDVEVIFSPDSTPSPPAQTRFVRAAHQATPAARALDNNKVLQPSGLRAFTTRTPPTGSMKDVREGVDHSRSWRSSDAHGLTSTQAKRPWGTSSTASVSRSAQAAAASANASQSPFIWQAESPPLLTDSAERATSIMEESAGSRQHLARESQRKENGFSEGTDISAAASMRDGLAHAPAPPSSVQRKLFTEPEEDDEDAENILFISDVHRGKSEHGEAPTHPMVDTPAEDTSIDGAAASSRATAIRSVDDSPRATSPPLVETVIELSCTSSDADPCEVRNDNRDMCVTTRSLEDKDTEPNCYQEISSLMETGSLDSRLPPPPRASYSLTPFKGIKSVPTGVEHNTVAVSMPRSDMSWENFDQQHNLQAAQQRKQAEAQTNTTSSSPLQHHPLYRKHHAAVSALYGERLLESERAHDELQLYLCWAEERAERRARRWQQRRRLPDEASSVSSSAADEMSLRCPTPPGTHVSCAEARHLSTVFSAAAQTALFQGAYTRRLGPRLHAASSCSRHGNASVSEAAGTQKSLQTLCASSELSLSARRPAVYVAPPADTCQRSSPNGATPRLEDTKLLTPASANSEFVAWIANEVDVYEGLLL